MATATIATTTFYKQGAHYVKLTIASGSATNTFQSPLTATAGGICIYSSGALVTSVSADSAGLCTIGTGPSAEACTIILFGA